MANHRRPSNSSRVSQKDDFASLPYFHSNFNSTEEVTNYIRKKSKGKSGSFLLRPSNRNRALLTASVLVPDKSVRHTHIQIEENGSGCKYFLVVEKKFDSTRDLVEYYHDNPVNNLENVRNVYLLFPLHRSDANPNDGFLDRSPESQRNGTLQRATRSGSCQSFQSASSSQFGDQATSPPIPGRTRNASLSSLETGGSASGGSIMDISAGRLSNIASRPPAPLPPEAATACEGPYYSKARDIDVDMSQKLKDALKSSERCECGIPRHLAELPLGWTVHLSKDPPTAGRLFYQNEEGVTSWTLPEHVRMQLTKVHYQNLKVIDSKWTLSRPKTASKR